MYEEHGNIISNKTLCSLLQDQHCYKTKLKQILGIHTLQLQGDIENNIDSIDSEMDDDYMNNDEDYFLVKNNNSKNTLFKITIPYEKYEQFKPSKIDYKNNKSKMSYNV